MTRRVVTIVGGGAFVPQLCDALARAGGMPPLELRLTARRLDRLQAIAAHTALRIKKLRPDWIVSACDGLEAGLEGAEGVILLIRVGGLTARAWDETFPRRYGLVGDEGLGPGGLANGWRTLPVLRELAAVLRARAPNARVLNLVAPLGLTTRLLLEEGIETWGVCELPCVTLEKLVAGAGTESARVEARVEARYGGLNHLGWFWDARAGSIDLLQAGRAAGVVDGPTLERSGAAPLHYYYEIFDREAGRRLELERRPGRAQALLELSESLVERFRRDPGAEVAELAGRRTPWFDHAVAPILAALLGGPAHEGYANVSNRLASGMPADGPGGVSGGGAGGVPADGPGGVPGGGAGGVSRGVAGDEADEVSCGLLIPELPPGLVVEVSARYDENGVVARAPGPLPPRVARFLQAVGRSEVLAYLAARDRDLELLREALSALPLPIAPASMEALIRDITAPI